MTVIACSRKTMAADTRILTGGIKGRHKKIHHVKGCVAGYAGTVTSGIAWIKWLRGGADMELLPDIGDEDEFHGILLTPEGIWLYEDIDEEPILLMDAFYAIGEGAPAALAAMRLGQSPKNAVLSAAAVYASVGTEVTVLRMRKNARRNWISAGDSTPLHERGRAGRVKEKGGKAQKEE